MTDKIPTITGKPVKPCRHDAGHSCALAVTVVITGLTNCYAGTDRATPTPTSSANAGVAKIKEREPADRTTVIQSCPERSCGIA